jgi:hypothetical protein
VAVPVHKSMPVVRAMHGPWGARIQPPCLALTLRCLSSPRRPTTTTPCPAAGATGGSRCAVQLRAPVGTAQHAGTAAGHILARNGMLKATAPHCALCCCHSQLACAAPTSNLQPVTARAPLPFAAALLPLASQPMPMPMPPPHLVAPPFAFLGGPLSPQGMMVGRPTLLPIPTDYQTAGLGGEEGAGWRRRARAWAAHACVRRTWHAGRRVNGRVGGGGGGGDG